MRTTVNLATRPRTNQRSFWVLAPFLTVAAIAFSVFVVYQAGTMVQSQSQARVKLTLLQEEVDALGAEIIQMTSDLEAPNTQRLLEEMQFLNGMIRQKSFSWGVFFERVAASLPRRVRVLSISLSMRQNGRVEVDLSVGAKSADAIHTFMRSLEKAEHFSQVTLGSQNRQDNNIDPVQARLTTRYKEGI